MEHFDVVIVGAGLSGVGAACHLQKRCPKKTYAILEARGAVGGTWDLFRYPGIRSDSDMFTLGYAFRPWKGKPIADGASIRGYIRDTATEHGVDRHIRFHRRVRSARWSSEDAAWTVEAEDAHSGKPVRYGCRFLFVCSGYYSYDAGFLPAFPGTERFRGPIVHPQAWPEALAYAGKRVVVIGSGATAITLVPALADRAGHVSMLQRSPSYVLAAPNRDVIAEAFERGLPAKWAYTLTRWKNALLYVVLYQLCRRRPELVKRLLRRQVKGRLGPAFDIDTHFTPSYDPWDQRLCVAPDGDFFQAIRAGRVSVVTDHIDTFTEGGIRLKSGGELEADIIVTATGLNLLPFGGIRFHVDGQAIEIPSTLSYKGMMLSDVPNFAFATGYTNASWTLKCELACAYLCRLLNHMDRHGYRKCLPHNDDPSMRQAPLIDLAAGYVLRSADRFPRQGSRAPWRLYQNYLLDVPSLRWGRLNDGAMHFSG